MKKIILSLMFVCCGYGLLFAETEIKGSITLDEEHLKKLIEQVIRENPKLIWEANMEYERQLRAERENQQLEAAFQNRVQDEIDADTPVKGPADAPILIIEYSDFQCPYCANASRTMHGLLQRYQGKVKLAFRNNPLKIHDQAIPAAKAALAAKAQGKFWEYYDLLFANFSSLNDAKYIELAQQLGLDVKKFQEDKNSQAVAMLLEKDQILAEKQKFTGTPSFIINGVVVRGSKAPDFFIKIIDRLLAEIEKK